MSPALTLLITLAVTADQPVTVRATRGQELVYRGRYWEESGNAAADRRGCDVEARVYVLEAGPTGAEIAFLTTLRPSGSSGEGSAPARLELGTIDVRGRLTMTDVGGPPRLPLDGPPSLEPAGFVELPAQVSASWDVADGRRPPREWRIVGDDFGTGARCLKLIGAQESAGWRRPAGDVPAWRRTESVWLSPATGLVQRLERAIESRNPDGSSRGISRVEYERVETSGLQTTIEMRREILQAVEFRQKLTALLSRPERSRQADQFAGLVARIDHATAGQLPTPYRAAVLTIRRQAEAAERGEVPPPGDAPEPPPIPATVGRPATDFLTTDLVSGAPVRLARWRGKSTVLLFVRPDSTAAGPTLRLAADLNSRYGDRLHVAVLVDSDEDRARPAWRAFGVPLLAGHDVAELYGVAGPSRVLTIDKEGIVRHITDAGPGVIDAVQRLLSVQ